MPLGRRKVPFSGKAKKQQLLAKRQAKAAESNDGHLSKPGGSSDEDHIRPARTRHRRNEGSSSGLLPRHMGREDAAKKMEDSRKPLEFQTEASLEVTSDCFFPVDMTFPIRQKWDYSMTKQQLDGLEYNYCCDFYRELLSKSWSDKLNCFERNPETWRQLWRVMEMLDIALIITDIRYPVLQFPPSLFKYITGTLGKHVILVLNKIDFVPASLVVAWKHYLQTTFPGIHIITFSSYPSNTPIGTNKKPGSKLLKKRKGKFKMAAEGALKLYKACKEIVGDDIDISSWHAKIMEEMETGDSDTVEPIGVGEWITEENPNTAFATPYQKFERGVLTIGCIGYPNVGKSSLINALMGNKVVSVSRTPGRTKHFQTIFLTSKVRLCDCPGLVFPSLVPIPLQPICGSSSIAQLSDPYTSVKYLAERVDLVRLLNLKNPDIDDEWSTIDICDAWAVRRGFFTAKASHPDTYRAANELLRMALDGKIILAFAPPEYFANKAKWEDHDDVPSVKRAQYALSNSANSKQESDQEEDDEEEEEDESDGLGNDGDESSTSTVHFAPLNDESDETD